MKLSRRSFFGFLGGAAAATTVAPSAIVKKTTAVGPSTSFQGQVSGRAIMAKYYSGSEFITPDAFAQAFLNKLRSEMILGKMVNGKDS